MYNYSGFALIKPAMRLLMSKAARVSGTRGTAG